MVQWTCTVVPPRPHSIKDSVPSKQARVQLLLSCKAQPLCCVAFRAAFDSQVYRAPTTLANIQNDRLGASPRFSAQPSTYSSGKTIQREDAVQGQGRRKVPFHASNSSSTDSSHFIMIYRRSFKADKFPILNDLAVLPGE